MAAVPRWLKELNAYPKISQNRATQLDDADLAPLTLAQAHFSSPEAVAALAAFGLERFLLRTPAFFMGPASNAGASRPSASASGTPHATPTKICFTIGLRLCGASRFAAIRGINVPSQPPVFGVLTAPPPTPRARAESSSFSCAMRHEASSNARPGAAEGLNKFTFSFVLEQGLEAADPAQPDSGRDLSSC